MEHHELAKRLTHPNDLLALRNIILKTLALNQRHRAKLQAAPGRVFFARALPREYDEARWIARMRCADVLEIMNRAAELLVSGKSLAEQEGTEAKAEAISELDSGERELRRALARAEELCADAGVATWH